MIFEVVGITPGLMIQGCEVARPKPWEVDDELWAVIEPLPPKAECRIRHRGRKRHPDRLVFQSYGSSPATSSCRPTLEHVKLDPCPRCGVHCSLLPERWRPH